MRRALIIAGAVLGALVLALIAAWFFVDVDAFKPRVEAAASNALGMDVKVEGPLHIAFGRGLELTLGDVRVRNGDAEIATVEKADVALEILPLIRKEIDLNGIALKGARIAIERGRDGKYNYERADGEGARKPLDLPRLAFEDLVVTYRDKATNAAFDSGTCEGELTRIRHPGAARLLARLSAVGEAHCSDGRNKDARIAELKFTLAATDGVFDFKPLTMRAFGGEGSGSLRVDHSAEVPAWRLDYALKKFRIEEYFRKLPKGRSAKGPMDFSISLAMRGRTRSELRRSAMGEMSLSGTNLTLTGVDLDRDLSKYESSQKFNLFDVAAFAFAGPLGLAVTKGSELASLVQQEGGTTPIRTVVSKWKIEKGVAHARDVALTTPANRLALHGALDFVDDEFQDVVVALVDARGCAKVRQKIRGPFNAPVIEKPDVLTSIAGPVKRLLKKAKEAIAGKDEEKCEVFYAGSVAPPG